MIMSEKNIEIEIRHRLNECGEMLRITDAAYVLGVVKECVQRRVVKGLWLIRCKIKQLKLWGCVYRGNHGITRERLLMK